MENKREKSFAAHCMDTWLHNDEFICHQCTVPIIEEVTKVLMPAKSFASEKELEHAITVFLKKSTLVKAAIFIAKNKTITFDKRIPTSEDVEMMFNEYVGWIAEAVIYQLRKI